MLLPLISDSIKSQKTGIKLQCDLDERLPSKMGSHSYCYGDSKDDRNVALEIVDTRIEFTLHGYLKSIAQ